MISRSLVVLVTVSLVALRAHGYGPAGHEMVGTIADGKLAGRSASKKARLLLGGVSLARAATLADDIKRWDGKTGPIDPHSLHLTSNPALERELFEFWRANPASESNATNRPSHHWFHYTDVPVEGHEQYGSGTTGRSRWDIVQMMRFCIRVVRGEESDQNPRKITKPVALVLLAHFAGDIHQPLHVGAEYFDRHGHPVNPDANGGIGLHDEGGNGLILLIPQTNGNGRHNSRLKLHGFWDNQAAASAMNKISQELIARTPGRAAEVSKREIAQYFIAKKPNRWKADAPREVLQWPENWANEMLPLAREAHDRLEFLNIQSAQGHEGLIASGTAKEKAMPDGNGYADWAADKVRDAIHRAGWRLAELLETILK